jgi:hypothetical protein
MKTNTDNSKVKNYDYTSIRVKGNTMLNFPKESRPISS